MEKQIGFDCETGEKERGGVPSRFDDLHVEEKSNGSMNQKIMLQMQFSKYGVGQWEKRLALINKRETERNF